VNEEPDTGIPLQPELRLARQAVAARDRIHEALEDLLERALTLAIRGAIVLSGPFASYTADRVREMLIDGFETARAALKGLWDEHLEPWVGRPGNSARMEAVGVAWGENVAGQMNGMAGWLSTNGMAVDDRWKGVAAKSYVDTLPAQKEAVKAIREKAESVGAGLENLAAALRGFWAAVIVELGNAATQVAGIALGWLGVNTGERAGEIIRELIKTIVNLVNAFREVRDNYSATVARLARSRRENDEFPQGLNSGQPMWPAPGYGLPTERAAWAPLGAGQR
jgi:hypothetical protein